MAEYDGVEYSDYNKKYRFRVNYHVSQDMTAAVSTITMYLTVETTDKNRQYNNYGNSYWNMTGTGDNYIKFDIAANQTELYLGSSSIQVTHDNLGNGAFALNAYWYTGRKNSNYIPEAMSMSKNITLQNIPRQSSISMSTANIEEPATITITSASSAFTHSVYGYFGTLYVVMAENQRGGTFNWTIPSSFYTQIPNSTTGRGTIYCETYLNGAYIGLKTAEFNVTTNADKCRPTVTGTVVDTNEKTIALTGNANKLIKGKSIAKIAVSPSARNSATLKSVKIDGVVTTDNTRTIANITKSSFPIEVIDSRGYSNISYSATASGGIVNYIPLTLNVRFFRPQPTGSEIQLTYSGNFFNGNFGAKQNSISIEWHYKVKGSSSWIKGGTINPTISGNTIVEQTISLGDNYDYQTAYEFYLYAQDFLTSYSTTSVVSVGLPVFNWGKDYLNVNGDIQRHGMSTNILYTHATTPNDGTSIDAVNGGGELQRTKICSIYDASNNWYNLINIRHRNGEGDGVWYGMQIRRNMTELNAPMQTRAESNGAWTSWEQIPRHMVLYDNASGTTGTVTLSETSANFAYFEVYYGDKCIKVSSPNGKTIGLHNIDSGSNPMLYIYSARCTISEKSITQKNAIRTYFTSGATASIDTTNIKGITKVVGYR